MKSNPGVIPFLALLFLVPLNRAGAELPAPQYVQFSPIAVMGAVYYPDPKLHPKPHIAVCS